MAKPWKVIEDIYWTAAAGKGFLVWKSLRVLNCGPSVATQLFSVTAVSRHLNIQGANKLLRAHSSQEISEPQLLFVMWIEQVAHGDHTLIQSWAAQRSQQNRVSQRPAVLLTGDWVTTSEEIYKLSECKSSTGASGMCRARRPQNQGLWRPRAGELGRGWVSQPPFRFLFHGSWVDWMMPALRGHLPLFSLRMLICPETPSHSSRRRAGAVLWSRWRMKWTSTFSVSWRTWIVVFLVLESDGHLRCPARQPPGGAGADRLGFAQLVCFLLPGYGHLLP